MNLRLSAIAAAIVLVGASSLAAEPRLRARAIVEDGLVTLGDVLDDAGAAADAVVARAPEPGRRMMIGVSRIYAVARAGGLDWRPRHGIVRIVVHRASRRIARPVIEEHLRRALAGVADGEKLRVTLAGRAADIHLPTAAPATLDVENLAYDRKSGRFSAAVVAAPGTPWETRSEVMGTAVPVVEVPALRHRMRRGEIIAESDLGWIERRADRLSATTVTDPSEIVGLTPRRALRAGEPIRARDVRAPVVVAKGATVTMSYRTPTMALTVAGRALEDGATGETIRVLNIQSNRVIEAAVASAGLVNVTARRPLTAY